MVQVCSRITPFLVRIFYHYANPLTRDGYQDVARRAMNVSPVNIPEIQLIITKVDHDLGAVTGGVGMA